MTLVGRVGDASTLVGVLLVLITLFTSEQARALDVERHRDGGPRLSALRRVAAVAAVLAVVTAISWLTLVPLGLDVVRTCCSGSSEPVLQIFDLVWMLMVPLVVWQVLVALGALRLL